MIYDCFTFFNELEILELRLQLLYDVVDKFVLVESTKTHSNVDKELFYELNKKRYSRYQDKIIHIVVSEFPEFKNSWTLENYQRNQIFQALTECKPEDIIMISDADEIPKPEIISKIHFRDEVYCLVQDQYFFFYNYRDVHHLFWIGGTKVLQYSVIQQNRLDEKRVRYNDQTFPAYLNQGITATKIRLYDGAKFIYNGGWHFSYLGGVKAIFKKVRAFAHQELNNEHFLDEDRIETCLKKGEDVFGRKNHQFIRVKVSAETHPEQLLTINQDSPYMYTKISIQDIPFTLRLIQLYRIRLIRWVKKII